MTGMPQKASSVSTFFFHIRTLVKWMVSAGYARFSEIDRQGALNFLHHVRQRTGASGKEISPGTVEKYLHALMYFYWYRHQLDGEGLAVDPLGGASAFEEAGLGSAPRNPWPHTPDGIAAEFVTKAIYLVEVEAARILSLRQVYASAMLKAERSGYEMKSARVIAARAIREEDSSAVGSVERFHSTKQLAQAIDRLYAACFIVISYLAGARVSEILRLQAGCAARRGANGSVSVIVGAIFKHQQEYHGKPHEWVAPPPAITAIAVLEKLSEGHRAKANRQDLWLRQTVFGATEWKANGGVNVEVIPT